MSRKTWLVVLAALVCVGVAQSADAAMFAQLMDFGGPGLGPGDTGSIAVFDDAPPPWLHDIRPDLGGVALADARIANATLTVSYRGTDGNEQWALLGDGISLGLLSSTGTRILTTSFPLNTTALTALSTDGLFNVVTAESTPFRDGFRLYEATLSGEYTVIPEPPVSLLFTAGLLALGTGYRRDT